jgi:uncharacterized membrane protein
MMKMELRKSQEQEAKETSRVESFSDGVFAIAITLLILDIHVPVIGENDSLLNALMSEWTSLLALLIGFFTILICWINHHYMFQVIHRCDSVLLLLNGFKLLIVTLTPFATAVLSKYIQTSHEHVAVSIYCFNFSLMGLAMTGLFSYAYHKGFVSASSSSKLAATHRLYIFAGIYSTVICLVSFVSILVCLLLFAVMFVIFLFPKQMVNWQVTHKEESESIAA